MLDPHCLTRRSNHLDKHRDFLSELHLYLQLDSVIILSLIFDSINICQYINILYIYTYYRHEYWFKFGRWFFIVRTTKAGQSVWKYWKQYDV